MNKRIKQIIFTVLLSAILAFCGVLPGTGLYASAGGSVSGKIYWTESKTVSGTYYYRVMCANSDGSNKQLIYDSPTGTPQGIAVDAGYIYFSDPFVDTGNPANTVAKIFRVDPDGSNLTELMTGVYAESLAIDSVHNKIYWTESKTVSGTYYYRVMCANLDGSNKQLIYDSPTGTPQGIAVDADAGYIYFSDPFVDTSNPANTVAKIFRTGLDGSNLTELMTGVYAESLAIDSVHNKIYWTESKTVSGTYYYRVMCANSDGSNKQLIYDSPTGTPQGIAVDADAGYIYFSDPLVDTGNPANTVAKIFRTGLDGSNLTELMTGVYAEKIALPITASNAAPVASAVSISGTAVYGNTLTGSYTYSDLDSDAQGTSTFKWYRSDNTSGLNKTAISGATAITYTLQTADAGKYINFEVTPVASAGTSPGTAVQSAYTAVSPATASYDTNLVLNGSAEVSDTVMTGWNSSGSVFMVITPVSGLLPLPYSADGGNVFDYYPGVTGTEYIYQTIDISNLADDISSGLVNINMSAYARKLMAASEDTIMLELLDNSNNVIATYSNSGTSADFNESWETLSISENSINTSTRKLRIKLIAVIAPPDPMSDYVEFDGVSLILTKTEGPTVTDGNISISGASGTGGAYIIGDTVTATWDNTASGDNVSNISTVTVDFSQFGGGSAVSATNSAGTWTATYTITAGAIDTTNRNVSVTATNGDGIAATTADTTNATVDSIAPIVTDGNISVSGGSGSGGAFIAGDTVTAVWNNTAGGDNNSDIISSVTVDFSQFGGGSAVSASNSSGTWTATYNIAAGSVSVTNRNVSVTATDNAGNITTTADTTNSTLENSVPAVTSVNVPVNGIYISGDELYFTVNFSESLTINTGGGTPRIALTIGGTTKYAAYISGSGTSAILFRYTIESGLLDVDGIAIGTLSANGGTMRDAAGNDANLTLNSVGSTASVLVDSVAPMINSVSVPANGTYVAGHNLDFTVNFSESVTANTGGGTPRIALMIGGATKYATYISGSGTSALLFRYTVESGLLDSDGIAVGVLSANGGTIKDAVGNNANLTLNSVGSTTSVLVDTVDPAVTSVSVPANGTYIAGQNLNFAVNFSENVTVNTGGGTPRFALTISSTTKYAIYLSGSGTSTLVFRYTVEQGLLDGDGVAVGAFSANGGTIRDAAGNDATLTLNSVGSTASVLVDAVAPTVSSVDVPSNGTYTAGDNLDFTINFSENVTATITGGTPYLTLTIGTSTVNAVYVSGSGTSALVFRYTVASGDKDTDGIVIASNISLNSGTIKDAAGNNANLTFTGSTLTGVIVKASQTIIFANPGAQNYGTSPTLTATSNSGLTVAFTSDTPDVCTVTSEGVLTFLKAGLATISANQAGNSEYLPAATVTQSFTVNAVVPGAPTSVTATAGNTQATVSFAAPASNGGADITSYTVTSSLGAITASGTSSSITVTGLTNGVTYTFTVTATNSAGIGTASSASNSVTPRASQTITFANPGAQDYGTNPTLTATASSGLTVAFTSDTPDVCTITSEGVLTFLKTGTATISANQAGNSGYLPAATVTQSFTVNAVVPGAPTSVTATAGNGQATVSFTAPAFNGGANITGYTVTSSPGAITASGTTSSITVTGLTNGVEYTFKVTATNSAGIGASSAASNSVTPIAPTYTITASAGSGAGISPSGAVVVTQGSSQTFTITPETNYNITSVWIDGVNKGVMPLYTFSNVTANHTINVFATKKTTPEPTAAPTATPTPTVTPAATPTATPTATVTPTATPVPSATETPVVTALANARTITGRLLDADGNPMAGYVVELHSDPVITVTNTNGEYAFYDVDYTNHELIVKTAEGKTIAEFELAFSEGEEFRTDVSEAGADITYTRSTETINIEVKLIPDQSGAAISQVVSLDDPQAIDSRGGAGSTLLWIGIGVLAVILIVLLIILLLKKRKED